LIQTQEVLRLWLDDHPDQKAVNKAIEAIGIARAIVKNLETSLPRERSVNSYDNADVVTERCRNQVAEGVGGA
jgi:hypothetical protein